MAYQNPGNGSGRRGPEEEFFRQLNEAFEKILHTIKNKTYSVGIGVGIVLLLIGVFSSYYTVQPNEEAVVIRLGEYIATEPPGLHFKVPFGVDKVIKVKTKLVLQQEFGFRTKDTSARRTAYSKSRFDEESLMLTGDLNVADVEWVVQYQIADPFKFIFQVRDSLQTIRDISQAVMRRVVGDRLVNEVLTTGRVEIANDAKELTQGVLDRYGMGVRVVTVKLQDVNPPETVKASFNEVNAAKQEQEKVINQAEKHYNNIIPEAKGKADELISRAEGYAVALVNRAKGDATKFSAMLKEYKRAPEVTKKRLYLETMEELFSGFENVMIVDSKVKGLLPVFGENKKILSSGDSK